MPRDGGTNFAVAGATEIDSFDPAVAAAAGVSPPRAGDHVTVGPRSVLVLRAPRAAWVTEAP